MNDPQALLRPQIQDREALGEFAEVLADRAPGIERDMARLSRAPGDRVVVADLFRALHNIKGDAAMCKLDMAVQVVHPIESLLARLRSGELRFTQLLGEAILLAVDRLELATEALVAGKSELGYLRLPVLVEGLEAASGATQTELDHAASRVIENVTGFQPRAVARTTSVSVPALIVDRAGADLGFFRSLAMQFEARSPLFRGRTARVLELARETNRVAGDPVDERQLEAAIYLHDVGMMFLPESIWLKTGKMNEEDRRVLRVHPGFGAGLLERMDGWREAAEIVLQHHEMPDGAGYPNGIGDAEICAGAKILAIVDAFEAVMLKHGARGHKRSALRAVAEVNACGNQFSPEWIAHFNVVIRRLMESSPA